MLNKNILFNRQLINVETAEQIIIKRQQTLKPNQQIVYTPVVLNL